MIDRRGLLTLGGLSGLSLLAGCGFQPLYDRTVDSAVAPELAAIDINTISEGAERRVGQILRNELINRFTAGIGRQPTRYVLLVEIYQQSWALQVQTNDTITRLNLVLNAKFALYDAGQTAILYGTDATATGSYDVLESEYATLAAEQFTAENAARDLAGTITNLLSLYFFRQG